MEDAIQKALYAAEGNLNKVYIGKCFITEISQMKENLFSVSDVEAIPVRDI